MPGLILMNRNGNFQVTDQRENETTFLSDDKKLLLPAATCVNFRMNPYN